MRFVTLALLALSACASCPVPTPDPTAFRDVTYISNYDGDTITVDIPGAHPLFGYHISVRVLGVDTPEIKGKAPCERERAQEAKEAVANFLKSARQIDLVNVGKDKYFRILADVLADGRSLRDHLLSRKLAYPYDGGTKQTIDWCLKD